LNNLLQMVQFALAKVLPWMGCDQPKPKKKFQRRMPRFGKSVIGFRPIGKQVDAALAHPQLARTG
jgi:hypothetical protein